MSLPPEDTDLSTNSAHEYALQIGSNVSAARVVGSAVGQRFSPSPEAHPNVIEIPSWENSPVAPSRSEEAAPNAAAAQLLWAENQGLATSHLLPTEPTFETLNTNAYSSPPGDSRFTFPNQNYSPLLPRCVPVPNQRYSPSGSPIHQLHELQNCPLIDSPLRLPPPSPKEVPTPSINRTVDALIDLDQNQQVIYYIQQYNNEPVLYQQNIGSGFHVYYQAPEDNQPIVLHIVEHNPQIITESQEQTNQILQQQDQLSVPEIQKQSHQFESKVKKKKLQPFSEYQQKGQQLSDHIENRQIIHQEFTNHSNQVYSKVQYIQTIQTAPPQENNSFEVQPANEVKEFQRDGELNIYPGRQHQNFVVEGATPLPHAEAQPGPTPEDISDSVSLEHGEPIESFNPNTICIRNTFQLIREISDSLVADPEQPEAANHRLSLYLLRKKLADVSHRGLTEAIHGRASDQCITILREILEQTKELRPRPKRPTKDTDIQTEISMGLEILKKIRGMLSGWYTSRESETDSRETGTGFQAQNGKGRGAGRQPENNYLSKKRRNQEENPRLVKYRRVDNSFPRLITNETAEDLIPNNSMAERDKPQSSKRLSIFNPPVYTQHRVRNEAPYIPTPFDDEESSQRFANAGPSSRPMTYSDAVRLGQNGIAESRVNGHSSHSVRSASARVQGSILLHEMIRKDQEQYTDLIRTAAQSNSMGGRCVKPGTPPTFQRGKAQSATGSGYYLLHDNQSNIRNSHPPSHGHANRELTEYAKLISRQDENRAPTPQQPKRNASNSSASHSSTTSSSGSSCSTCSTCSTSSDSEPKSVKDSSEVKEAKKANETNKTNETNVTMKIETPQPQPQPQPQPPTRRTKIGSLQQRFANCVFLRDDFAENFKARAIRRQGASMHLLGLAEQQANVSTDERIAYEKKLREIMFRSGTPHRPFFEIRPVDQPDEKNETKLIPLTQEQYVRFRELTTSPITKNVISNITYK
ncbi:GD15595 [Drosophila simulans]|uniref:GD15595 n=1 Tax=Drosophila simulans TaxID=7240 RepID=B4R7C2_DROSI|nr:GD15595 [Drosophila simulans]